MQRGDLKYKVCDLIDAAKSGEVDVIAHGCNCFNTMKSGIAPKVAEAFPSAWRADQNTIKGDKSKLGTLSLANQDGVFIYNLYSQYTYTGRRQGKMDLDYWALKASLERMANSLRAKCRVLGIAPSELRVGLPKIGAGLAGGDWGIISRMIQDRLGDFDVCIYVLKESEIVN